MPPARTPDDHQLHTRCQLGERIRTLRHVKGLSQERLGELCGIDRRTISRYERGERPIDIDMIASVARALGVEPWQLFYDWQ